MPRPGRPRPPRSRRTRPGCRRRRRAARAGPRPPRPGARTARRTPRSQFAARRPTVVGTACCVSVRAAATWLRCARRELRRGRRSRFRSDASSSAPAPRATSTSAVSRMSWLVAPRCTQRFAASGTRSRSSPTRGMTGLPPATAARGEGRGVEAVAAASARRIDPAERVRHGVGVGCVGEPDRGVGAHERHLGGDERVEHRGIRHDAVVADRHGREQSDVHRAPFVSLRSLRDRSRPREGSVRRQGTRSPSRPAAGCRAAGCRRAGALRRA